ncbi:MAG: PAS domain S-box protein [Bacteroidia bacterium]
MKILFLEEKQAEIKLLESVMEDAFMSFESRSATNEKEFIKQVSHFVPDLILSGNTLTKYSAKDALTYLTEQRLLIPFIFIVKDKKNRELIRSFMDGGADDYVSKSDLLRLPVVIKNVLLKKNAEIKKSQAERIKKTNENKLHTIFDNEPECIFQIGLKGELIEMNPAALELTESSSKIKFGKSKIWEFIDKHDIKKIKSYHQSIFRGHKKEFIFRFVGSKGTPRLIATRAVPLRDSEDYVTSALLLGKDITEKTYAVEEQKKSEEKFRMLAENSPVGIYYCDVLGNCIYVNKKWCELSGYSFEEALGDEWRKALHQDDRERVVKAWKLFVKGAAPFHSEYRLINKEGKVNWVVGNASVIKNDADEPLGFIGTVNDITGLKEKEQQLEQAERNFYEMFNNSPDAIYIEDENGTILNVNKQGCIFQAIHYDELIGTNILSLAPNRYHKEIMTNFKKLYSGEISRLKTKTWNKKGFEIPIEIHAARIVYNQKPALLLQVRDMSNWMDSSNIH